MKEFKIRVWDLDCGIMRDWEWVRMREFPFYYEAGIDILGKEFVLMQYTGLKDRNGDEIYEGDVVYGSWNGRLGKEYHTKIVEFRLGAFDVWSKFCEDSDDKMDCEIIGNVHEYTKAMGELPPYLNM